MDAMTTVVKLSNCRLTLAIHIALIDQFITPINVISGWVYIAITFIDNSIMQKNPAHSGR